MECESEMQQKYCQYGRFVLYHISNSESLTHVTVSLAHIWRNAHIPDGLNFCWTLGVSPLITSKQRIAQVSDVSKFIGQTFHFGLAKSTRCELNVIKTSEC